MRSSSKSRKQWGGHDEEKEHYETPFAIDDQDEDDIRDSITKALGSMANGPKHKQKSKPKNRSKSKKGKNSKKSRTKRGEATYDCCEHGGQECSILRRDKLKAQWRECNISGQDSEPTSPRAKEHNDLLPSGLKKLVPSITNEPQYENIPDSRPSKRAPEKYMLRKGGIPDSDEPDSLRERKLREEKVKDLNKQMANTFESYLANIASTIAEPSSKGHTFDRKAMEKEHGTRFSASATLIPPGDHQPTAREDTDYERGVDNERLLSTPVGEENAKWSRSNKRNKRSKQGERSNGYSESKNSATASASVDKANKPHSYEYYYSGYRSQASMEKEITKKRHFRFFHQKVSRRGLNVEDLEQAIPLQMIYLQSSGKFSYLPVYTRTKSGDIQEVSLDKKVWFEELDDLITQYLNHPLPSLESTDD